MFAAVDRLLHQSSLDAVKSAVVIYLCKFVKPLRHCCQDGRRAISAVIDPTTIAFALLHERLVNPVVSAETLLPSTKAAQPSFSALPGAHGPTAGSVAPVLFLADPVPRRKVVLGRPASDVSLCIATEVSAPDAAVLPDIAGHRPAAPPVSEPNCVKPAVHLLRHATFVLFTLLQNAINVSSVCAP